MTRSRTGSILHFRCWSPPSSTAVLLLLALALSPKAMTCFSKASFIRCRRPLQSLATRSLSRPPVVVLREATTATMLRWETTGEKRAGTTVTLHCSSKNNNNNDDDENIPTASMVDSPAATMLGWSVREALDASIRRLASRNVTEPEYSARYLMAAALRLPWERGIRDLGGGDLRSASLTAAQALDLEAMLRRREDHEPIQYVLGQWDFLEYTIAIRKPLLCPRPETEELVAMVVAETTESPVHILDVGCGTGVIGIAIAELLPDATVEAIDVEPVAIETSLENAQRVLRDQNGGIDSYPDCYRATLVSASDYVPDHPFDVVVSNPPYIPRGDMNDLSEDVVSFESDEALCGGTDGMDVIRTIIRKLPEWCNTDAVCWMEVDPSHPALIEELLSRDEGSDSSVVDDDDDNGGGGDDERLSKFSGRTVRFESSYKDMFGKDRFVKLRVL